MSLPEDSHPTEEPTPEQEIFHLDLHAIIEAQQAAHGVRHDDFAQYHGYCSRRLSRLSHLKDVKKYLVCSAKYATIKPEGNKARHAYCSRWTDTFQSNYVPHINILLYLLVQSERAWAQANQYSKEYQKRQLILKKLKRASGWADRLLEKAQVVCDPTSIQECQAYASWMKANYALEKLDYAVSSFSSLPCCFLGVGTVSILSHFHFPNCIVFSLAFLAIPLLLSLSLYPFYRRPVKSLLKP